MKRMKVPSAGMLLVALLGVGATFGEETQWYEKLDFGGDFRLRYEGFDHPGKYDDRERNRFRYRLRLGFETKVNDNLRVGVQMRSGNPNDPVSDNQTLDGGFSKKSFSLAEAYVDYAISSEFSIIAGKFSPKKLWKVSDMQYDDDIVSEGFMARWHRRGAGDAVAAINASVFGFALEEASSGKDAYLIGAQFRPTFRLGETDTLSFGVGYENYANPQVVVDLTVEGKLSGNKVSHVLDQDGNLVSDFEIVNAFVEWRNSSSEKWPVTVSAFLYENLGAEGAAKNQSSAVYARVQIGKYKKPGEKAFRLTRYLADPDAIFYAWAQSDTTRGSNVDGWRGDFRLGLRSNTHLNITWYRTRARVSAWNGPSGTTVGGLDSQTMNRWQLDYILKF